jgi:hypothetical protein
MTPFPFALIGDDVRLKFVTSTTILTFLPPQLLVSLRFPPGSDPLNVHMEYS